jgi:hypothetical protein
MGSTSFLSLIYLDWNIFNKLEHLSELNTQEIDDYIYIDAIISNKSFITPYSNAHINDLVRGYAKDPSYTPGHLLNITRLTNNLCLTQYWGEQQVRWHIRDPKEYLEATIEEQDTTATSFSTLFSSFDSPIITAANELRNTVFKLTRVPEAFKKIYTLNPIFNSIYPRTKVDMNLLALCEDIFEFSRKIKTDYTLYKNYRKFMNDSKTKFPEYIKMFNNMETGVIGKPKYLTWDEMWDDVSPNTSTSSNAKYDQIIRLFTTTDLKGYRQDERFANLIDDALHCFYAAHCKYFITLDARCYDKAKLVYNKLDIETIVFTPTEFRVYLSNKAN